MLDITFAMHGSASSRFHLSRNDPIISAGGRNLGFTNGRYLKFRKANEDNPAGAGIDTDAGWTANVEVEVEVEALPFCEAFGHDPAETGHRDRFIRRMHRNVDSGLRIQPSRPKRWTQRRPRQTSEVSKKSSASTINCYDRAFSSTVSTSLVALWKPIGIDDENARPFYETESLRGGWSEWKLHRQISTRQISTLFYFRFAVYALGKSFVQFSRWRRIMETATVVTHERSQSVELPEGFQFDASEVYVKRVGRSVLLIPKDVNPWDLTVESLQQFTGDFMQSRVQPAEQTREAPFE
jgi:virulence-associated protein VagC